MTAAHEKEVTIRIIERWPEHDPREDDPHYKVFLAAKKRLKANPALWRCHVPSAYHAGQLEVHHSVVEFAHGNDVDVLKLNEMYGLHLDDEQFATWIEDIGNCEVLCVLHHRGQEGVHSLPEPEWNAMRLAREGVEVITALSNNEIPVTKVKP